MCSIAQHFVNRRFIVSLVASLLAQTDVGLRKIDEAFARFLQDKFDHCSYSQK